MKTTPAPTYWSVTALILLYIQFSIDTIK